MKIVIILNHSEFNYRNFFHLREKKTLIFVAKIQRDFFNRNKTIFVGHPNTSANAKC